MNMDSDELTLEDYKILGLDPPEGLKPKGEQEGAGSEQDEDEPGAGGTDEEDEVDYKEKLEQFQKVGAKAYYELYPDEKTEEEEEEEEEEKKPPSVTQGIEQAANVVMFEGPHKGKTLKEVFEKDPLYANMFYMKMLDTERTTQRVEDDKVALELKKSQDEVDEFGKGLATEMYSKNLSDLTPENQKKVETKIDEVLAWMKKTGRGGAVLKDAHILMSIDDRLKKAKKEGVGEVIDLMIKEPPSSTSGNDLASASAKEGQGYDYFMNLSPTEAADYINKMDDATYTQFLAKAPLELKTKFPKIPWS